MRMTTAATMSTAPTPTAIHTHTGMELEPDAEVEGLLLASAALVPVGVGVVVVETTGTAFPAVKAFTANRGGVRFCATPKAERGDCDFPSGV